MGHSPLFHMRSPYGQEMLFRFVPQVILQLAPQPEAESSCHKEKCAILSQFPNLMDLFSSWLASLILLPLELELVLHCSSYSFLLPEDGGASWDKAASLVELSAHCCKRSQPTVVGLQRERERNMFGPTPREKKAKAVLIHLLSCRLSIIVFFHISKRSGVREK